MERIIASGIVSSYGKKNVLNGVDISAQIGQCVGIVGANGCGKSTLFNILSGLRRADKGDIFFDGQKADKRNAKKLFTSYTGYVPQENNLIPELTVKDNLIIWYKNKDYLEHELKNGFLQVFGIENMYHMKAGTLSGGMKKRVSIACALAGNPPILILDEPDAALDLPGKDDIRNYLVMYKQMGGTLLLATHEESDLSICDRIYILCNGKSKEIDKSIRGKALIQKITNKE